LQNQTLRLRPWGGARCSQVRKVILQPFSFAQTCDRKACAAVCRGVRTKECAPAEPPPAVPPPSASAGSPPHGHGHAQPRRHRRHRHRRRRCPPLPAPRLHLQPPPSCRAASSCGLHVDAASADTRAAVALSLGCHLCMLLVVPCRSKACCVQLHCRAGGSSCIVLCTEAESECIDAWHLPLFAGSLGRVEQVAKTRVAFCRSFSERGASRR
jgi:hypothetical protein